jgi:hypothetical protein
LPVGNRVKNLPPERDKHISIPYRVHFKIKNASRLVRPEAL